MSESGIGRREFLRGAVAASAAGMLAGCRPTTTGDAPQVDAAYVPGEPLPWRNWGGNQACRPEARLAPATEDEIVSALSGAHGHVRPVGAGHSFSGLVPTDGALLATDMLNGLVSTDAETLQCEVWSGTRLHQLGPLLEAESLAMPNLPDIDYQTLAGAVSTSTHGTGATLGSLASIVEGVAIATPSGELIECDRTTQPEVFHAARCSFGALGVLTRLRIQCVPPFELAQRIHFEPLDGVLEDVVRLRDSHRHLEVLAFPHTSMAQVLLTDPDDGTTESTGVQSDDAESLREAYRLLGGIPGVGDFLFDAAFRATTAGMNTVHAGPSWRVLTHTRLARFKEMEYTVEADAGVECLREIMQTIREQEIPVVYPVELRYVKRDDIWLSMFHERDGCTISIHQFADERHGPVFDALEPIFWKYEGRPHWGKLHTLDAARLSALYPRWRDFQEVRRALDPEGRMLNPHLRELLGA